jgi:DNA mismatch repair protein MSH6
MVRESGDELAMQTLGMAVSFLEDTLIAEKTLKPGQFFVYTPESQAPELENMVLDSQCLQHLNIIDPPESNSDQKKSSSEGSLLGFIDHCRTPSGKR